MNTNPELTANKLNFATLPALPNALIQLIEVCNDSEVDITLVGQTVALDGSISGKILQLANSAFLGSRATFSDIEQAVIFLGIDSVRNLAISVSVHEAFKSGTKGPLNQEEFWYHSLFTALLAKNLAELSGYALPSEAYLAGLLHDIGKCVLNLVTPKEYKKLLDEHDGISQLDQIEKEFFGFSHSEIGAQITAQWKLEPRLSEAIAKHHDTGNITNQAPGLAMIVFWANILAGPSSNENYNIQKIASACQISRQTLQTSIEEQKDIVFSIAESMGMAIAEPATPPVGQPSAISQQVHSSAKPGQIPDTTDLLREKVLIITGLHGLLENLSQAQTTDRIFMVLEESLQILFNIEKCFLLLPDQPGNNLTVHGSSRNMTASKLKHVTFPLKGKNAPFTTVLSNHKITVIGQDAHLNTDNFDKRLKMIVKEECLVGLPLPITPATKGVLVLAISADSYDNLQKQEESLVLLSSHVGNRLHLERIKKRHAEALVHERISATESIAQTISHEISNPLATIQNYINLLIKDDGHPDKLAKELNIINNEFERINTICKQLDHLAKAPEPQKSESILINSVIKETLSLLQSSQPKKANIIFSAEFDDNISIVRSRPDAIRQILNNLLSNSIEAVGAKGNIIVSTRLLNEQGQATPAKISISVADDGPGISTAMSTTLYKAGHTTKGDGNSGLGLAIVKKLSSDIGATIEHCSNPTAGTTFTLTLPTGQNQPFSRHQHSQ